MARVVVRFCAHHVTRRGNHRHRTFFGDEGYLTYLEHLSEFCRKAGTRVRAYCLIPNHVHLVMAPSRVDGLRAALGEAHRRYTRGVNFPNKWRGHLGQARFHSFPMDEAYLLATLQYAERNPVAARMCRQAQDWPWSSSAAHLRPPDDGVVEVRPTSSRVDDWAAYLSNAAEDGISAQISKHSRTGRRLGDERLVEC